MITGRRALDREILQLSAIAFLTLVTEPLFLLADSAIVGRLGTPQLAALGVAAAVLGTLQSLCIFLAYGTTGSVARLIGAGDARTAFAQGVDGCWLAVGAGVVLTAVAEPLTPQIVDLFGPGDLVAGYAVDYLRIAFLGTVPLLVVLAAVGMLRGVKDLRTPLRVAVVANLANIGLNYLLVYPLGLGIRGSAIGTLLAQTASAVALLAVVLTRATRAGATLVPYLAGIRAVALVGIPLIIRTLMLRAALLMMTFGAARLGSDDLATMQLALTIWSFLAFTLDALGISAQTLVGHELGRGDLVRMREVTNRLVGWGVGLGVATGVLLLAGAAGLGHLFTDDPRVLDLLAPVLVVAAVAQPFAGVVFTLDGILIGAGDGAYLAAAQTVVLAVFTPLARFAVVGPGTLTWLWVAFAVGFMGTRTAVLLARSRGIAWIERSAAATG